MMHLVYPGLLFMHIPKTAGSSLNAYLESQYPKKEIALHIENQVLGVPKDEISGLIGKRLLTAHLKYNTLLDVLDFDAYFSMTLLREPIQQTLSHLAWINRLGYPEGQKEFNRYPDYIKQIVERMHSTDIVTFLDTMDRHEINFFDNCQTRYLLPFHGEVALRDEHLHQAERNLTAFDLVGLLEKFHSSLVSLAFYMGWQPPKQTPQQNPSDKKYFIDLDNADEVVHQRIERITRYDSQLYQFAADLFEGQRRKIFQTLSSFDPNINIDPEDQEKAWVVLDQWLTQNMPDNHVNLRKWNPRDTAGKILRRFKL